MSEAQSILVVFGVLYFSECILWISSDAVCFTGFGRWLRLAWKPEALGNSLKQVFVLSLWPGAKSVVAMPWRIVAGNDQLALKSPSRGWLAIDYPGAEDISAHGTSVQLGELSVDLQSTSQAQAMQRWLRRLVRAEVSDRPAIIAHMVRNTCDPERARRVMEVTNRRLYSLRQLAGLLLLWTFAAGPVFYVFSDRSTDGLIRFGAVYLGLWWLCAVVGFRCHRRMVPALRKERWSSLVLSLISPPHAIREADRVMVHRGREMHPLAFAIATMHEDPLLRLARTDLAELRFPVFPAPQDTPDSSCTTAEGIVRDLYRQLADELAVRLSDAGYSQEQLVMPEEQHPDAVCWCPRCFNQFTQQKSECEDCDGIALVEFSQSSAGVSDENQSDPAD